MNIGHNFPLGDDGGIDVDEHHILNEVLRWGWLSLVALGTFLVRRVLYLGTAYDALKEKAEQDARARELMRDDFINRLQAQAEADEKAAHRLAASLGHEIQAINRSNSDVLERLRSIDEHLRNGNGARRRD